MTAYHGPPKLTGVCAIIPEEETAIATGHDTALPPTYLSYDDQRQAGQTTHVKTIVAKAHGSPPAQGILSKAPTAFPSLE